MLQVKLPTLPQKQNLHLRILSPKKTKQEMVFEIKIAVNDPSETIKPGMFVDVRLAGE